MPDPFIGFHGTTYISQILHKLALIGSGRTGSTKLADNGRIMRSPGSPNWLMNGTGIGVLHKYSYRLATFIQQYSKQILTKLNIEADADDLHCCAQSE